MQAGLSVKDCKTFKIRTNGEKKMSLLSDVPTWALAILIFIGVNIVYYVSDALLTPHSQTGIISNILNDILIAAGCFFLVRRNPKSIWYVPLMFNALLIISSIVEPNFWKTLMWISICGGWVLSIIASIIGAIIGRRAADSNANVQQ
jgi:hypothetical protein